MKKLTRSGFIYFALFCSLSLCGVRECGTPTLSFSTSQWPNLATAIRIFPSNEYQNSFINGNSIYVAGSEGIQIVDISDITAPTSLGIYKRHFGYKNMFISGDYGYSCYSTGIKSGLEILNISNPLAPVFVATQELYLGGPYPCVVVQENYAYATDGHQLFIVNIMNPATPAISGTFDLGSYIESVGDIDVSGNYVYIGWGYYEFQTDYTLYTNIRVIDVSNPASPVLVSQFNLPDIPKDIFIAGDYIYVADGYFGGLVIIDVSNPLAPTLAGAFSMPGYFEADRVYVSGDYAFVVSKYMGLFVVDISNPSSPALFMTYLPDFWSALTNGYTLVPSISISGSNLFLGGYPFLYILDISN